MEDQRLIDVTAKLKAADNTFEEIRKAAESINKDFEANSVNYNTKAAVVRITQLCSIIKILVEDSSKIVSDKGFKEAVEEEDFKMVDELLSSYMRAFVTWENYTQYSALQIILIEVNQGDAG